MLCDNPDQLIYLRFRFTFQLRLEEKSKYFSMASDQHEKSLSDAKHQIEVIQDKLLNAVCHPVLFLHIL